MGTYCFSDIHGNYKIWTDIKNYYKKNDTLIFLGDACDRGPDGIKILQEMFEDKRVIFLLGNHEEMLLDYIKEGIETSLTTSKDIINFNGSYNTLIDFQKLSKGEQEKIVSNLKTKTKFSYIYINKEKKNIFLSHAGIDLDKINDTQKTLLLWDRTHIEKNKNFNIKHKYWYVIHGHTPVQIIDEKQKTKVIPNIYKYYNKHKIDIDMGTYNSKVVAVLNLDTFQTKYFMGV